MFEGAKRLALRLYLRPQFFPITMAAWGVLTGLAIFAHVYAHKDAYREIIVGTAFAVFAAFIVEFIRDKIDHAHEQSHEGISPSRIFGSLILLIAFELTVSGWYEAGELFAAWPSFVTAPLVGIKENPGLTLNFLVFAMFWIFTAALVACTIFSVWASYRPASAPQEAGKTAAPDPWLEPFIASALLSLVLVMFGAFGFLLLEWAAASGMVLFAHPEHWNTGACDNFPSRGFLDIVWNEIFCGIEGLTRKPFGNYAVILIIVGLAAYGTAMLFKKSWREKWSPRFNFGIAFRPHYVALLVVFVALLGTLNDFGLVLSIAFATGLVWLVPVVVLCLFMGIVPFASSRPRAWGMVCFLAAAVVALATMVRHEPSIGAQFGLVWTVLLIGAGIMFLRGANARDYWPISAIAVASLATSLVSFFPTFLSDFKQTALLNSKAFPDALRAYHASSPQVGEILAAAQGEWENDQGLAAIEDRLRNAFWKETSVALGPACTAGVFPFAAAWVSDICMKMSEAFESCVPRDKNTSSYKRSSCQAALAMEAGKVAALARQPGPINTARIDRYFANEASSAKSAPVKPQSPPPRSRDIVPGLVTPRTEPEPKDFHLDLPTIPDVQTGIFEPGSANWIRDRLNTDLVFPFSMGSIDNLLSSTYQEKNRKVADVASNVLEPDPAMGDKDWIFLLLEWGEQSSPLTADQYAIVAFAGGFSDAWRQRQSDYLWNIYRDLLSDYNPASRKPNNPRPFHGNSNSVYDYDGGAKSLSVNDFDNFRLETGRRAQYVLHTLLTGVIQAQDEKNIDAVRPVADLERELKSGLERELKSGAFHTYHTYLRFKSNNGSSSSRYFISAAGSTADAARLLHEIYRIDRLAKLQSPQAIELRNKNLELSLAGSITFWIMAGFLAGWATLEDKTSARSSTD